MQEGVPVEHRERVGLPPVDGGPRALLGREDPLVLGRGDAAPEPLPTSAIYARALARTIHKARKRARGE